MDLEKTILEIQISLNISRASVQAYLAYKKYVYIVKELILNAERIRRYRHKGRKLRKILQIFVLIPSTERYSPDRFFKELLHAFLYR